MTDAQRFSYSQIRSTRGEVLFRPLLTLSLINGNQSVEASGLLDTGADVNVLPYGVGRELGAVWEEQRVRIELSGNLANYEARGIILTAVVGTFAPVRLAFAWTSVEAVPLILGQMNFFVEFDACFFRSQMAFELRRK
jgi:hypothetical protein